jgi:hypothetical protein
MVRDFKFAFRQLLKAPGFTIAAVIVLALGIGANSAVFSLVNTLFVAPPAYAHPHELVQVFSQDKKNPKTYRTKGRYAARLRRHCQLELFFCAWRFARAGPGIFARGGNSWSGSAGRDRQQ